MRITCFDFTLPKRHIAVRPKKPRDHARLLHVPNNHSTAFGHVQDYRFYHLPDLLKKGDVLVFNDAKVINARLKGIRIRAHKTRPSTQHKAQIEITLNQKLSDKPLRWSAFAKPARKMNTGDILAFDPAHPESNSHMTARIDNKKENGLIHLTFPNHTPDTFMRDLKYAGHTPLPPYILSQRHADAADAQDYQTVYAKHEGAVAAPTAGLHFTPELMRKLKQKGVTIECVTLIVGAGTFLPVKTEHIDEHTLYAEYGFINEKTADTITGARQQGSRIIAVGTTSLRLLESASDTTGITRPFSAETSLFIKPGFSFNAADMLITNFHLPKSTLFMLVCAFAGYEEMKNAYHHAIKENYRFYSYGDACLLERK